MSSCKPRNKLNVSLAVKTNKHLVYILYYITLLTRLSAHSRGQESVHYKKCMYHLDRISSQCFVCNLVTQMQCVAQTAKLHQLLKCVEKLQTTI